jgi:hypothetical protein
MDSPDLLRVAGNRLSRTERAQIASCGHLRARPPGRTIAVPAPHRLDLDPCFTKHLRHVHGLERLPRSTPRGNFILVQTIAPSSTCTW